MSLFRLFRLPVVYGLPWPLGKREYRHDTTGIPCETAACILARLDYYETENARYHPHANGLPMPGKTSEAESSLFPQYFRDRGTEGVIMNIHVCLCAGPFLEKKENRISKMLDLKREASGRQKTESFACIFHTYG